MEFYLASGSPRRRELLTQIGIEYKVLVSDVEENPVSTAPQDIVEELSKLKATDVAKKLEDTGVTEYCVLGADTVVSCDGKVMGKPKDEEDAVRMLKSLAGNTHQVYTGVTLCLNIKGEKQSLTFNEKTDVTMYEMSEAQIRSYVATGEPLDKAGAYGIQGYAAAYMKEVRGEYSNVVGLPVGRVFHELCKLKIF